MIQKQKDAMEEDRDFQYMGGWDNPFFEINNNMQERPVWLLRGKTQEKDKQRGNNSI